MRTLGRRTGLRYRWQPLGVHAKGQQRIPAARHHAQPAQPGHHPTTAVRRPGLGVQPAGPEPGVGCRPARKLQTAQPGQLPAQPGVRRGRHAQALGRADRQQPRQRRQYRKWRQRLDGPVHPGQRTGPEEAGRLEPVRWLQVHPARRLARRLQRLVVPPGRDQRQGLFPGRQLRSGQERRRQRSLAELRSGVRRAVRHRRLAA
ncbi:hypothetical protein D3C87_1571880 [compost metagenome]